MLVKEDVMRGMSLFSLILASLCMLMPDVSEAKHSFGNSLTVGVHETVDEAVSVTGDVYVYGVVEKDAVSVGGDVIVEAGGEVGKNVVSIGGDVIIRSGATVKGDLKSIGGEVKVDPGANVKGDFMRRPGRKPFRRHPIGHVGDIVPGIFKGLIFGPFTGIFGAMGFMFGFAILLLKLLFSFAVAAVITYLFPNKVSSMALYLRDDFPKAMLLGVVVLILTPVTGILLLVTIIGIPLVPLFIVAMYLIYLVGSVGVALWVGRIVPEAEGRTMMVNVLLGVLAIGIVKNIPVLGAIVAIAFTAASFGVMLMTHTGGRNA